jgi:hypothetical protein
MFLRFVGFALPRPFGAVGRNEYPLVEKRIVSPVRVLRKAHALISCVFILGIMI